MSVLTAREKSVVQLIAEGQTNKKIADVLSISLKTVELAHGCCATNRLMPAPAVLYICAFTMRRLSSGSPNEPGVSSLHQHLGQLLGLSMPRLAMACRKPLSWKQNRFPK